MGKSKQPRRSDADAGCRGPPARSQTACAPAGDLHAVVSERLAGLAALEPGPCLACGVRRSNGAGWSGRCAGCFASASWRELLRDAPRPDRNLQRALSPVEVSRRLRQAVAADDGRGIELPDDETLLEPFKGQSLSESVRRDVLADSRRAWAESAATDLLASRAARAGVGTIEVPADGWCQYHSAAVALYGAPRYRRALRAAVHDYVRERQERGERECAWLDAAYLADLQGGAWGDILTLGAIAHVTGSEVVVATAEAGCWVETKGHRAAAGRVACLTVSAVHYNVAIPAEHAGLAGACMAAAALEDALAAVRAAADAPGGEGLAAAEQSAGAEAARILGEYAVDPALWFRALEAAQRPLQRPPAPGPAPGPLALAEGCAGAEGAARQGIATERERELGALRAAERAARGDAQERGAERAARLAAVSELAAAREAASAAQRAACRLRERALQEVARAAGWGRDCISATEAARRERLGAAAGLRGCQLALRAAQCAARGQLRCEHSDSRAALSALESRERWWIERLFASEGSRAAAAAAAAQRAAAGARRGLAESEALQRGALEQTHAEGLRTAAAAMHGRLLQLVAQRESEGAALRSQLAAAQAGHEAACAAAAAQLRAERLRAAKAECSALPRGEAAARAGAVTEEQVQWRSLLCRERAERGARRARRRAGASLLPPSSPRSSFSEAAACAASGQDEAAPWSYDIRGALQRHNLKLPVDPHMVACAKVYGRPQPGGFLPLRLPPGLLASGNPAVPQGLATAGYCLSVLCPVPGPGRHAFRMPESPSAAWEVPPEPGASRERRPRGADGKRDWLRSAQGCMGLAALAASLLYVGAARWRRS